MNSISTGPDDRATTTQFTRILGARTHNLKNLDVDIPRDQLVVITGRSGSGKSSLAFNTLYAEGQRQYIESLSLFSRQFFNQLPRADVDAIEGLQPTLCLDQNHHSANRRSTVGTVTEIYHYLRVLMARAGDIHCYGCGLPIRQQTPQQIRDTVLKLPVRTKVMILSPMVTNQPGMHQDVFTKIRRERLVRVRVDGQIHDIDQLPEIFGRQDHSIEAITDRIIVREDIEQRLLEAIDTAVRISRDGQVICSWLTPSNAAVKGTNSAAPEPTADDGWQEKLYSTRYACPDCDIHYAEVQPRTFSFNSPLGACPKCEGLGQFIQFDADLTVDRKKSIDSGAIKAWDGLTASVQKKNRAALEPILKHLGVDSSTRLNALTEEQWQLFLNCRDKKHLGVFLWLSKELATTSSSDRQDMLERMQSVIECGECEGSRLARTPRSVFLSGKHIGEIVNLSLNDAVTFFQKLKLEPDQTLIADPLVKQILHRLTFLQKVGVGYLTLGRSANTLSGGEHQRVRLATSIGSGVTHVCFVLDEPSIGLHQRDNDRLIDAIRDLQKSGNSVVVVEHDEAMIRAADHVIDMGPGAGNLGGQIVATGSPAKISKNPNSVTGNYLAGRQKIETPAQRRSFDPQNCLKITGASGHNLQAIDVEIPLQVLCCVTGVSGSGKSTLINQTLAPVLARRLDLIAPMPAPFESLVGHHQIDKLISVNQKPIGRTPRACPVTYLGVYNEFRRLFAATKLAKQRGYGVGRFSFNSKTGWCPDCQGHGTRRLAMNFMPDVYVTCETCHGKRFNPQTLQIRFGELTIADVLEMTVDRAIEYFDGFSKIRGPLQSLADVGLGYLLLGQASTTLSGGEAQRIKLATELARQETGNTLYILDEPTTGLHFEDIRVLISVLNRLVDQGNSMIVIEHNLDVIRMADWVIDLGPEGGSGGGRLVGAGTPEDLAENQESHTGRFLREML